MALPEYPESCKRLPEYTLESFVQKFKEYLQVISYIGVYFQIINFNWYVFRPSMQEVRGSIPKSANPREVR